MFSLLLVFAFALSWLVFVIVGYFKLRYLLVTFAAVAALPSYAKASDILTMSHAVSAYDSHVGSEWYRKVTELILDKTKESDGDYRIVQLPAVTSKRNWNIIVSNKYENYYYFGVYNDEHFDSEHIYYIPFPIQMGLLGYRVCFQSAQRQVEIAKHVKKQNYKALIHVQGRSWTDVDVLKYNGYTVHEMDYFDGLFKTTAIARFDLFCRGLNEVLREKQLYAKKYNLNINNTLVFHYEFPVFFYTHRDNKRLIERMTKGLILSHKDGSLSALFEKYYAKELSLIKLEKRTLIELENPMLKKLPPSYKQYNYPLTK